MPIIITQQPSTSDTSPEPDASNLHEVALRDLDGRTLTETDMTSDKLDGCDDLDVVDRLFIRQRMPVDLKEGCGAGNTYNIQDENGRTLFRAEEERNCFCRWFCGPNRAYHITVYNRQSQVVLHLDRSCCRCDWCCCLDCCFCQHAIEIRNRKGDIIGKARQRFHVFHLKMDVTDAEDEPFCGIQGPCCPCRCCTEMNFDIVTVLKKKPVGYISKRFPGYRQDFNVDHENFEVYYPRGLDVPQKATLLGAAFLVNFMYFEMS